MNKTPAIIISFLIVILIITDVTFFKSVSNNKETVIIDKIIDGDTLKLKDGRTLRLLNINSPEKSSNLSKLSIEFMKSFENKTIKIEITGQDKYNRYLARVYSDYYINLELVKQGLSSIFMVDESELKLFSEAENNALKSSRGIWKKSPYFGCISTKLDYNQEKLLINNLCTLNLNGFYIKDESRKTFIFSNITSPIITLHSGIGEDNITDIYWNSKEPIWNNDRDTIYIFDNSSFIVYHQSYGY